MKISRLNALGDCAWFNVSTNTI